MSEDTGDKGLVPRPDPTTLTTQQLAREILALREFLEARMDGTDALNQERFKGIQTEFGLRDARAEGQSRESKLAVDAAFAAAKEANAEQARTSKEAVDKSEKATLKQIDQLLLVMTTAAKASDDKIDDVKERLTRIEGKGEGIVVTQATSQMSLGTWSAVIFGVIMTLLAIGSFVFTMVNQGKQ